MPSLSFDPFASIYDATRGYPDDIAQQVARAIDSAASATSKTTYLEVGIGTGRIAFPLASLGRTYTGVDISEKMVAQLEEKLRNTAWRETSQPWGALQDEDVAFAPIVRRFEEAAKQATMRLVMADITKLPFANASFDVVIAVHVFHLVDGWQEAVQEVRRVLRSGGVLLHCHDEWSISDVQKIGEEWRRIVRELGGKASRPGASSERDVTALLQTWGLQTETECVLTWEQATTPRLVLEDIIHRRYSHVWVVPENIFAVAIQRLEQWVNDYYGEGIDTVRKIEQRFMISRTRM